MLVCSMCTFFLLTKGGNVPICQPFAAVIHLMALPEQDEHLFCRHADVLGLVGEGGTPADSQIGHSLTQSLQIHFLLVSINYYTRNVMPILSESCVCGCPQKTHYSRPVCGHGNWPKQNPST